MSITASEMGKRSHQARIKKYGPDYYKKLSALAARKRTKKARERLEKRKKERLVTLR